MQRQYQKNFTLLYFLNAFGLFLLLDWGVFLIHSSSEEPVSQTFRIGFASSMFTDVNENDARAAVRIWGEQIAREKGLHTNPDPAIFKNTDEILKALQAKEVDAVGINTTEFDILRHKITFNPLFIISKAGLITEKYVLLAHKDGRVKKTSDLRGATLRLHTNPRACLSPLWLDILLIQQGRPIAALFAGKILWDTKLSKVILPVFFRQADACVVTRSGFDTMSELNPQLARELIVIAESPEMVPALFAFRADYNPEFKEKVITGLRELKDSPAGQQVLNIFQSDDIEVHSIDRMKTSLELIQTHKRLVVEKKRP